MFKKGIGNDRLDTLIWCLNQFYDGKSNLIFNFCSADNLGPLKSYFGVFKNAYEYCNVIYGIDKALISKLINSGKKAIDSPERVIEYMSLAKNFWQQKKQYINNCL